LTVTFTYSLQRFVSRLPLRFCCSQSLSGSVSAKSWPPASSSSLARFPAGGCIHAVICGWFAGMGIRRLPCVAVAAACDDFAAAVCAVKTAFLCAWAAASCAVNVSINVFPSSAYFFLKFSSTSWRIVLLKLDVTPTLSRSGVVSRGSCAVSAASTRSAKLPVSVLCSADLARRLGRRAVRTVASSARGVRAASFAAMRASAVFARAIIKDQPLSSRVQRVRRPVSSCCNRASAFACRCVGAPSRFVPTEICGWS
jgi:hypothetical protein